MRYSIEHYTYMWNQYVKPHTLYPILQKMKKEMTILGTFFVAPAILTSYGNNN
jgi:hypothetical protein